MVFFAAMAISILMVSIPLVAMWTQGRFVGQGEAPLWAKRVSYYVVMGGVAYGALLVLAASRDGSPEFLDWLKLAWIAGSLIAAFVAFQEAYEKPREQNLGHNTGTHDPGGIPPSS